MRSQRDRTRRTAHPVLVGLLTVISFPTQGAAQTILGRVLDHANEAPVPGVIVTLVTREGDERVRTLSDTIGNFVIVPPEDGEYFLVAERFGYLQTRSPLLALGTEGRAPLELMMVPQPIGIEGVSISIEERVAEELQIMGLSPNMLGRRWISREKIEAIPVKMDMGVILERTAQIGMRVMRPENMAPGSDNMGLCVSLARASSGGRATCALVVLNGVPISGVQALAIDPETIQSIAVLVPVEATTYYGTLGGAGAVLVWTRRGR